MATTFMGPPPDPGVILIDADPIVAPLGREVASCLTTCCSEHVETFGLCSIAMSELRSLGDR
jgi:hypothetical protein